MTDTRSTHVEITGIPRDKAPDPDLGSEQNIFGYRYYSPVFAQKRMGADVDKGMADSRKSRSNT